jgi:hypothetical protein
MRLKSRLLRLVAEQLLEGHAEEAVRQEVLKRMSVDELKDYCDALGRLIAGGEPLEPAEADWPIFRRVQERYGEVSRELEAPA